MEDKSEQLEALRKRLAVPPHSDTSSKMNGFFNGLSVGVLVPVIYNFTVDNFFKNFRSRSTQKAKWEIVFATLSTAIGTVYGFSEAKSTTKYREAVVDEFAKTRADIEMNKATLQSWLEKEKAREKNVVAPETTR